jgi:3-oxoacyl-[acyl-carrier protein] reductase
MQDLEQLTAAEIDLSFAVNARATMLLVKLFAAHHDGAHAGRVVLMTSGQHRGPMPGELPYIASKGALHQLTASLAAHLAPRGITINTVDPGATDTGWADERVRAEVLAQAPMGRWGQPDDAARLVCWLAGPDAGWVTGQVIVSSGGGP